MMHRSASQVEPSSRQVPFSRATQINSDDVCLTLTSGGCNSLHLCINGARKVGASNACSVAMSREGVQGRVECLPAVSHGLLGPCASVKTVPLPASPQVFSVDCNPAQSALLELKAVSWQGRVGWGRAEGPASRLCGRAAGCRLGQAAPAAHV